MSEADPAASDGQPATPKGEVLSAPVDREPSAAIRFMVDLARFGGRQLVRHRAPQLAAALAYRTIFSLIPVLVLSLVIFKAFLGADGVRRGLENVMQFTGLSEIRIADDEQSGPLSESLVPDSSAPPATSSDRPGGQREDALTGQPVDSDPRTTAPEGDDVEANLITDTIRDYVDHTVDRIQGLNFGAITVVGVLVLIYAALTLIVQVEQAFNVVCRAPSGRKWVTRLVTYWALLTLGPLFLVGGLVLANLSSFYIAELPGWLAWAAWPLRIISKIGLTWIILILAYVLLPNTRVMFRPAAVGALVATILWESLKSGLGRFGVMLTDSGTQFAVYGSLALIPLFMLWVYITWLIVLFGLELAFALQTVATGRVAALERREGETLVDPGMAVLLVAGLADGFRQGRAIQLSALARRTGLPETTTERVLEKLRDAGIVHRVEQGRDAEAFALARSPKEVRASDVLAVVDELAGWAPGGTSAPENTILRRVRGARDTALHELTIDQIAPEHDGAR